eukprot:scaffold88678_cov31-Tisochrysis_lutea.AAC.5
MTSTGGAQSSAASGNTRALPDEQGATGREDPRDLRAQVVACTPVCLSVISSNSSSNVPNPPGATMSACMWYAMQNLRVKK